MSKSPSAKPQEQDEDLKRLKWAMLQLKLKPAALAKCCGMRRRRIYDLLSGKDRCWPIRAAVNKALSMKVFTEAGSGMGLTKLVSLLAHRPVDPRNDDPVDITACKIAMLEQGLKPAHLAQRAGLPVAIVCNVLAANDNSWPPREKINRALGQNIFQKPAPKKRISKPNTKP